MKKAVLITGASRGIGRACALSFAKAGYRVGVNFHTNSSAAANVVRTILEQGGDAMLLQADVTDYAAVSSMVSVFGRVDILVNNAGIACDGLLQDVTPALWAHTFAVNVNGAYHCVHSVLPQMLSRHDGCILNVSSMWGRVGAACEVPYSAAKAALIGFTKALAKEVGPSGIRVNCVAPGVIDTAMNALHSKEDMAALAADTPLMRLGTPEDVAHALVFLASEQASFITGQVLGIDGGFVM
ncbi:MAG: 3-oxoacyl-ACP reductase FabG [Eubacteriales bacterium]|nr:3-oxoacyl-ACP reductase FabG [Eubacteriales bacterium]